MPSRRFCCIARPWSISNEAATIWASNRSLGCSVAGQVLAGCRGGNRSQSWRMSGPIDGAVDAGRSLIVNDGHESAPTEQHVERFGPIAARHVRGECATSRCRHGLTTPMVSEDPGDHVAGHRRQVQLRRRQMGVPEHPLHVGQRQRRVSGHPVGSGVTKVVQGPVGAERRAARANMARAAW